MILFGLLINSKNTDSWMNDLSDAQDEGNIFHQIMEEINSKKETSIVLNRFCQSGLNFVNLAIDFVNLATAPN